MPSAVIGSGLDLPEPDPSLDFAARHGLTRPFILYVGRIDRMKGCLNLFAYFRKFVEETGLDVDLVLAGKAAVKVPTTRASARSDSSPRRRRSRPCASARPW